MLSFYLMQTSCAYLWTAILYRSTFPMMANDVYFWYINMVEFVVLLFVRTRASLYYAPKLVTCANIVFLVYINSYMYGATIQLLVAL
jgi:hypothetical protein